MSLVPSIGHFWVERKVYLMARGGGPVGYFRHWPDSRGAEAAQGKILTRMQATMRWEKQQCPCSP
jgi:hypothetical protein